MTPCGIQHNKGAKRLPNRTSVQHESFPNSINRRDQTIFLPFGRKKRIRFTAMHLNTKEEAGGVGKRGKPPQVHRQVKPQLHNSCFCTIHLTNLLWCTQRFRFSTWKLVEYHKILEKTSLRARSIRRRSAGRAAPTFYKEWITLFQEKKPRDHWSHITKCVKCVHQASSTNKYLLRIRFSKMIQSTYQDAGHSNPVLCST